MTGSSLELGAMGEHSPPVSSPLLYRMSERVRHCNPRPSTPRQSTGGSGGRSSISNRSPESSAYHRALDHSRSVASSARSRRTGLMCMYSSTAHAVFVLIAYHIGPMGRERWSGVFLRICRSHEGRFPACGRPSDRMTGTTTRRRSRARPATTTRNSCRCCSCHLPPLTDAVKPPPRPWTASSNQPSTLVSYGLKKSGAGLKKILRLGRYMSYLPRLPSLTRLS